MERKLLVLTLGVSIFVLLGLNSALATCANDPNDTLSCDTVRVDRLQSVAASSHVVINVNVWNDEHVGSFVIPLTFPDTLSPYLDVTLDSVSFVGTRSTTATLKTDASSIDNAKDRVVVYAVWFSGDLAPGSGVVAKLYFTTGTSWVAPNNHCELDTVFIDPSSSLQLISPEVVAWTPIYHKGALVVDEVTTPNLPTAFALHQNYPNPFNPTTTISFDLVGNGRATLVVYNVLGQKVRTLIDEVLPAGTKVVEWNGRDDRGSEVASGVYFYKLITDKFTATNKMMMMK